MERECDECGKPFEAKRSTRKYCGDACKMRAKRKRGLVLVPPAASTAASDESRSLLPPAHSGDDVQAPAVLTASGGLTAATHKELEALKAVDTALGQVALRLAARIEFVPETGSGTAALSRELRQVLDAAKGAATGGSDRLDEISKRRQQKHSAAT